MESDHSAEGPIASSAADRLRQLKAEARRLAAARRRQQPEKERLSRLILQRIARLPEYRNADSLMFYVATGDEVRTQEALSDALAGGKRVIVPYCSGQELELFELHSLDELAPGSFGVLEPRAELRGLPGRRPSPKELDVIIVPGVAFDRRGARLGRGKGYYDRFLAAVPTTTVLIAPAFECQLLPKVPIGPHDVMMDVVVTERAVYLGGRHTPGVLKSD